MEDGLIDVGDLSSHLAPMWIKSDAVRHFVNKLNRQ